MRCTGDGDHPRRPRADRAAVREAATEADLVIVIAGSSAGRDDYTAQVVAACGTLAVHGVAVRPGHPVVLGVGRGSTPVLGVPGYPVSASLTFDIFAAPLLAALEGTAPRQRPSTSAAGPQARVAARHRRLGAGSPGPRRGRHRRHASAARCRSTHVACARRRAACRARRSRRSPRRRVRPGRTAPRARRDRPHDRRHWLARSRTRRRSLRAASSRPAHHPRVVQRRIARRAGRTARRAVPHRRITPARPRLRRLHLAVRGPALRRGPEIAVVRLVHRRRASSSPPETRRASRGSPTCSDPGSGT